MTIISHITAQEKKNQPLGERFIAVAAPKCNPQFHTTAMSARDVMHTFIKHLWIVDIRQHRKANKINKECWRWWRGSRCAQLYRGRITSWFTHGIWFYDASALSHIYTRVKRKSNDDPDKKRKETRTHTHTIDVKGARSSTKPKQNTSPGITFQQRIFSIERNARCTNESGYSLTALASKLILVSLKLWFA